MTRHVWLGCLMIAAVCANSGPTERGAAEAGELNLTVREERLPERSLRGFGQISGDFVSYRSADAKDAGSVLTIHAESEEKAKIVHSKFVSDLHALGGAVPKTLAVDGRGVPAYGRRGPRHRLRAPARFGREHHHLPDRRRRAAAAAAREARPPRRSRVRSLGDGADVPRLLGPIRLPLLRPWETPKDVKWKDYKVLGEFDFAKKENNAGFVFWADTSLVDRNQDSVEGNPGEQIGGEVKMRRERPC